MVEGEADNPWVDDEEWRKNANQFKDPKVNFWRYHKGKHDKTME